MKPLRTTLLLVLFIFSIAPAFAAMDMFLKIEGNGITRIIPLGCKDGTCKKGITKLENFKSGTYTFTICNERGDALKIEDKPQRRTAAVRLTTQITSRAYADAVIAKEMGTPMGDTICTSCAPKTIIEKVVPAGSTFSESIQIASDGVLLVDFSGLWEDGGIMFTDDWEPPVN